MGEDLLTGLAMDNHLPSTLLSMDSSAVCHEELDQEPNWPMSLSCPPPDINVPLSAERSSPPAPHPWNLDSFDLLDVGLASQVNESEAQVHVPKTMRKCLNRLDCVWGAWFFFTFYFKPVLNEKSKCKILRDKKGFSGFDKSDLELDVFLVQYDMENLYMWVFKERPENALGKMQLRSYMNGHFRQGENPFPFSVDKGFVRSHRMQRKHYRGLSNPQCVHGIEVVAAPNLDGVDEEELKRWVELTGRDLNFPVPPKASEFCSWRNLPVVEFELDKPLPHVKIGSNHNQTKLLNGSGLHLSAHPSSNGNGSLVDLSHHCNKRKKDERAHGVDEHCCLNNIQLNGRARDAELHAVEPPWINDFSGVMRNIYGPVTAAKTIYEDDQGYLLIVSLPFADLKRVKVTWWNNLTHGIVKISSVSTSCMPYVKRDGRTFKLTDAFPEHCPPGEFVREIPLPTRIPDDAKLEAYEDESGTGLEILVPKHTIYPEEHEVRVCLRPHSVVNELL